MPTPNGEHHHPSHDDPAFPGPHDDVDDDNAEADLAAFSDAHTAAPDPEGDAAAAAAPAQIVTQTCPGCGTLLDVSEQEPLARIHCPVCGTGMDVRRQFGNFAVIEKLGEGGMGAVFKSMDVNLNRMVALKLLRREFSADPEYTAKLEDEARITASINHPHVVKVFSFGEDAGQYFLALELVDKGSLDDLMQLQGKVAEIQVLQVGRQVAEGLKAAHERGLIHRDVKPGNILFADARTAKITDFGLALLAEREAESRGEIWGTPYYIAPEKLNQEPEDFRSDIYSLGGTLFHAVAGRPPFEAENASLVALKHLKSQAISLQAFAPDVAPETAYVVNRMLHKDPAERYQSYDELIEHLQYAADQLAERSTKPRQPKARVVLETEKTRSVSGLLTLALLLLLLAGGGLAYAFRDRLFRSPAVAHDLVAEARKGEEAKKTAARQGIDEAYQEARQQLVTEQFASAQDAFTALLARTGLTRPQADWIRLHQGMAALLNRQIEDADAAFLAESKADPLPDNLPLTNFFVNTARFLAKPSQAVPGSTVRQFNKDTQEAFSILLFGLKDWELGVVDDAAQLLKGYLDGKPPGAADRWIAEYRPLAAKRLHDADLYTGLRDRLKTDAAADKLQTLLREIEGARAKLQTSGKIVELMDSLAAAAKEKLAASRKDESSSSLTKQAAQTDEDKARWQAGRDTAQSSLRAFRFDEAGATLDNLSLHAPDFVNARAALRDRLRRLTDWKKAMIVDLNTRGGYPQPITGRNNAPFPKGISKANTENLLAATPYGEIKLAWTDLEPKTLLTVSAFLADHTPDPKAAAERRWQAATFASEFGLAAEARALAERAAQDRPEYRDKLGQFQR